nr:hypothetical protein B0A51_18073 [Rachicladosporium sp. CCFEE 5018]
MASLPLPCWGSLTYTHSPNPLRIPSASHPKRTLPSLLESIIPQPRLSPLLFNGHLQTAIPALFPSAPAIHYKRRVFTADSETFKGHFAVDFAVQPPRAGKRGGEEELVIEDPVGVGHTDLPERTSYFTNAEFEALEQRETDKPLLIVLHGLSGGSHEIYLRHAIAALVASNGKTDDEGFSGGDFDVLVANARGCAGSRITTGILYNARATWDVRQTVKWAREKWPKRKLFGMGFSLGANILANYLGEEGSSCPLTSAILVSNPWTLDISHTILQSTYIGKHIYSAAMGKSMRALFARHATEITTNTVLDPAVVQATTYLHEFDREVQCPTWGYPTEGAYYRDASSADAVLAIRIPTLCLHAQDDPIACDQAVPYEEIKCTPWVVMCATSGGGHLGWVELGGERWHAKAVTAFFRTMAFEVDLEGIVAPDTKADVWASKSGYRSPFEYGPLRRKLQLVENSELIPGI